MLAKLTPDAIKGVAPRSEDSTSTAEGGAQRDMFSRRRTVNFRSSGPNEQVVSTTAIATKIPAAIKSLRWPFIAAPYARIRAVYSANGWYGGTYGYPTAEQTCTSTECSQAFQRGTITVPV
jgi:hypothetical protein